MSNPKKDNGTTRHLGIPNRDADKGLAEFNSQMKRLDILPELTYINYKNGGHVIWEKGHKHPEEGVNNNEFKLAKAIADEGYWVHLLPEEDIPGAITLRLSPKGSKTFIDGKTKGLSGTALYEQWTPTSANMKYGILSGLEHANDKGCRLLAIYDPHNTLSQKLVEKGMRLYSEGLEKGTKGYWKMDGVITYNKQGEFHSWYWDDVIEKK